MKPFLLSWQFWAVLSAVFAALTAVFAKVGIQNINSDFATFIRNGRDTRCARDYSDFYKGMAAAWFDHVEDVGVSYLVGACDRGVMALFGQFAKTGMIRKRMSKAA
jgi:hypothetical protein